MKKLFLLSQDKVSGYDTFDSAVVVASTPEAAVHIHPSGDTSRWDDTWCKPEHVSAAYLGPCEDPDFEIGDVVIASFNAG